MKLLTFKKLEDKTYGDGENAYEWFVWLEDDDETGYYGEFTETEDAVVPNLHREACKEAFWSGYMTAKLGDTYTDEDIFYYFYPEDKVPAVGEKWELDDMVFERVK